MEHHWTDDVAVRPIFRTVIDATGPSGNIFEIVGTARRLLRKIEVPEDRIRRLQTDVLASGSYDAAVALVERWFAVRRL